MPTLTEEETAAIEGALNTAVDGEDALMKAMASRAKDGKLSEKDRNALKGALRLLGSSAAFADIVKAITEDPKPDEKPKDEPKPEPEAKPDETPEPEKETSGSDDVAKAHQAELRKRDDKIEALEKFQADMLEKADRVEVATLVEKMQLPGMSSDDQIEFVLGLDKAHREKMSAWAPALTKAIDLSSDIGSPRRGLDRPESAQDEIMRLAEARVEKDASGKTDLAEAIIKVRAEHPDLAKRSRLEALGQGG